MLTGGFVLLDMVTGLINAFKSKAYTSSVMREGLYHKCGSVLTIIFGILVDYAQMYIDIGVNIPMATTICAYICIMEIGSIIENVCQINPEIMPDKLKSYFKKLGSE